MSFYHGEKLHVDVSHMGDTYLSGKQLNTCYAMMMKLLWTPSRICTSNGMQRLYSLGWSKVSARIYVTGKLCDQAFRDA